MLWVVFYGKPYLKQSKQIKIRFNPLAWNQTLKKKYDYDVWTRAHPDAAIFQFKKARQKKCQKPWQMLSVRVNGDVGVCCYDTTSDLYIGNILKSSLSQILKGPRLIRIRRSFKNKQFQKYPLCYFCHA
ncbi:SPASM domain-containing protein [Candidatus Margulisiibacteriota bacterium]